jgi:hypothetical protein
MRASLILAVSLGVLQHAGADEAFPTFKEQTIDAEIGKVCYAVTLADVDGDLKADIVAVSENRVLWYQNPTWEAREIIKDQTPRDNVCISAVDIDGDKKVDFALGAGWTSKGTIHWLSRGDSLDDKWQVHDIGEERWLHRMRFANVLGKDRPQLVISPLNATVGGGVRLTAFEIPKDPVRDRWPSTVLNSELNRMHNHWHMDFDRDGVIDTLTASREGVHLIRRAPDGWSKTKLGTGATADDPNQSGAGEIKSGNLKDGGMFITTVEPMHGHSLAVYTASKQGDGLWTRQVIDEGFKRGHALWTADVDGDGADEIVFGHSDTPEVPGVNIYDASDAAGTKWNKHVIDAGGMATEDLVVADLTGDGRPDIVAGGRATHNVKLYVNSGK